MDFDADQIYYSHQNLQQQQPAGGAPSTSATINNTNGRVVEQDEEERAIDNDALRRHFREFLSEYILQNLHVACIAKK